MLWISNINDDLGWFVWLIKTSLTPFWSDSIGTGPDVHFTQFVPWEFELRKSVSFHPIPIQWLLYNFSHFMWLEIILEAQNLYYPVCLDQWMIGYLLFSVSYQPAHLCVTLSFLLVDEIMSVCVNIQSARIFLPKRLSEKGCYTLYSALCLLMA